MSARLRFTSTLVVLLVIGLGGVASSDDGDPVIAGQTVTAQSPTVLRYLVQNGSAAFSVYGVDTEGDGAIAGHSQTGAGVYGDSAGIGVQGLGAQVGVWGQNFPVVGGVPPGPAVDAESATSEDGLYGVGLLSIEQVQFSRASGLATIAAGLKSITLNVQFDLTAGSMVLATSQSPGGSVGYVGRHPAKDTFTIVLNKAATVDTPVAWFVISPYPLP